MVYFFSPHHIQLISACYPPSAALLTAGPEYLPNSQELSRLTYYASNRPGKVNKLGSELERRVKTESRKAKAGNTRSRATLLITLSIFRALATECRRDLALLTPSLISAVAITRSELSTDLEASAKVAGVFTAWTTYTDGNLIGVDGNVTQDYLSALRSFCRMGSVQAKSDDHEIRNRTRLVAFAALTGAVNSEALYNDSSQFKDQVSAVIRPILVTLLQTDLYLLNDQAETVKDNPDSPYLAEFRTRPAMERRAASIHIHVDGDKGPSMGDVANAALHVLYSLLEHSNGAQLGHIMQAVFDTLDELDGWEKSDHCCWLAQRSSEWSQYQYRYAVPTWLVERLLVGQDSPTATPMHNALAAMITTVFNSPTPLVNLSTSDIISNLITMVLRRVAINPGDGLLPALVECIASLGTHVYYSDQIQDLAGELISRLVIIEVQCDLGRGRMGDDQSRSQAIRCLLAGLVALLEAASKHESPKDQEREGAKGRHSSLIGSLTASPTTTDGPSQENWAHDRSSARTHVTPETWQDTLSLLCDKDYPVRADYSEALVSYLKTEIPKRGDFTEGDGVKHFRPLAEGPMQQVSNMHLTMYGDAGTRLLNAVHAHLYILATASSLGFSSSSSPSPAHSLNPTIEQPVVNVLPATPQEETPATVGDLETRHSPAPSQELTRRSTVSAPGSRKLSVSQRLAERASSRISSSASAYASDYANILVVLTAIHEELPVRALLTGVPMLLALDGATRPADAADLATFQRLKTVKEVIARVWLVIAKVWDCPELVDAAENAITSMPTPSYLPNSDVLGSPSALRPARQPLLFPTTDSDQPSQPWNGVDAEAALMAIVSSRNTQEATGLDRQGLLRRFANKWTAEFAVKDSVERTSTYDSLRKDAVTPLLKISPALMQVENLSMQSLARSVRGVGVSDLREALEGRSSMSNPNLAAPSISTLDHASSILGDTAGHRLAPTRSQSRKRVATSPGDVRDVLNKLGIKQNGGSLLKASFPALQKTNQQSNSLVPPYKP